MFVAYMENLTRENFWNKLEAKYPVKVKEFYNWFYNKYYNEVHWPNFFRDRGNGCIYDYFDLPIAMQIGIFMQFVMDGEHEYYFEISTSLSFEQIKTEIQDWFHAEHLAIEEDNATPTRIHDTDSD